MLSVFCSPSRYTQGKNATQSLGQEMSALGLSGLALIVTSRSAVASLSEIWAQTLPKAGFAYQVFQFGGECSIAEIERVIADASRQPSGTLVCQNRARGHNTRHLHFDARFGS
jgi:glycerol dehydrogenase